mgnify:FL=1
MKLTKSQLKRIIKEELETTLKEGWWGDRFQKGLGVAKGLVLKNELEKIVKVNPDFKPILQFADAPADSPVSEAIYELGFSWLQEALVASTHDVIMALRQVEAGEMWPHNFALDMKDVVAKTLDPPRERR